MPFEPIQGFETLTLWQWQGDSRAIWRELDGAFLDAIKRSSGLLNHIYRLSNILDAGAVKTVIGEEKYYDEDFVQAYQARYGRALWAGSPQCKRLHFFGKSLSQQQFLEIWCSPTQEFNPGKLAKDLDYLGFLTLQPLPDYPLGRIMLSTTLIYSAYQAWTRWNQPTFRAHFSTAVPCEACLCGLRLAFECTPFILPHFEIGSCSEDALWINLRTLHLRRALAPWISLSQITDRANQTVSSGHRMPSQGLTNMQITTLFRSVGLDPFVIEIGDIPPAKDDQLRFLNQYKITLNNLQEGGMPVILKVKYKQAFHMLVLVGHTYRRMEGNNIEVYKFPSIHNDVAFRHFSSCTEHYIVHDPLTGPYELAWLELNTQENTPNLVLRMAFPFKKTNDPSSEITEWILDSIIAANPPDISSDADEAETHAREFYALAKQKIASLPNLDQLILRTILMHNTHFKEYIAAEAPPPNPMIISAYRALSMPKWVYVTQFRHIDTPSGFADGEIVMDATTGSPSMSILSARYQGWSIMRDCANPLNLVQILGQATIKTPDPFKPYRAIGATDGQ